MPITLGLPLMEMQISANVAWSMYPGLSHGAYSALLAHGTDELRQRYLPKLVSGIWTGTMCLTEPQCGTDLGLIKTRAIDNGDGSYKYTFYRDVTKIKDVVAAMTVTTPSRLLK